MVRANLDSGFMVMSASANVLAAPPGKFRVTFGVEGSEIKTCKFSDLGIGFRV
jgi:hypothetical protein